MGGCGVKVREAPSVATDWRLSTHAQVACSRNSRSFAMSCAVGPTLAAEPKDKADCEAGPRNMERRSACVRRESKSYFTRTLTEPSDPFGAAAPLSSTFFAVHSFAF